jgi:hypothetical protein
VARFVVFKGKGRMHRLLGDTLYQAFIQEGRKGE